MWAVNDYADNDHDDVSYSNIEAPVERKYLCWKEAPQRQIIARIQKQMVKHAASRHRPIDMLPGLTEKQLTRLEGRYGFVIPSDVREFLSVGVPVNKPVEGEGRVGRRTSTTNTASCSRDGENEWHNWHEILNQKKGSDHDTVFWCMKDHATPPTREQRLKSLPLIPLHGRAFIPSAHLQPLQRGNPVLLLGQHCAIRDILADNFWSWLAVADHLSNDDVQEIIPREWLRTCVPVCVIPFWCSYLSGGSYELEACYSSCEEESVFNASRRDSEDPRSSTPQSIGVKYERFYPLMFFRE